MLVFGACSATPPAGATHAQTGEIAQASAPLNEGQANRATSSEGGYVPLVTTDNQTALSAARVPSATYLTAIHNRLHPIFAEEFLNALDGLPKSHPLRNMDLGTHIEIVLNKDQGRIVRMDVTRASGVIAFDGVALRSIDRAQPFGRAPDAIVSPDGNVHIHWEFRRAPFDACPPRNARVIILEANP